MRADRRTSSAISLRTPIRPVAGAVAFALLAGAVELGEADDGDVEFAGEGFEAAGDCGDLDLAGFACRAGGGEELEVVDHDGSDAVLGGHAAGAGAELEDGEAGGVIDEDRKFLESVSPVSEKRHFSLVEMPGAHAMRVNLAEGAQ